MRPEDIRFASRFEGISGSAIREIFKLLAVPGMISFAGGNPAASALPDETCAELAKELLLDKGKILLQYGATEGYAPLRESLVPYLKDRFSFDCAADEILPVTGSTQAMDLLCKALIDPGDKVVVETPRSWATCRPSGCIRRSFCPWTATRTASRWTSWKKCSSASIPRCST